MQETNRIELKSELTSEVDIEREVVAFLNAENFTRIIFPADLEVMKMLQEEYDYQENREDCQENYQENSEKPDDVSEKMSEKMSEIVSEKMSEKNSPTLQKSCLRKKSHIVRRIEKEEYV